MEICNNKILKNFFLLFGKIYFYPKYIFLFSLIYIIIQNHFLFINKKKGIIHLKEISQVIKGFNFHISLYSYISYIKDCQKLKRYSRIKITNEYPFLSICISAFNIEKYIEISILSVINQLFQDFEIIIVNDFSKDNTLKIIEKLQIEDDRIKIINHNKNLGTYHSRVEGVLNSKGKYILFLDPDDMILNPNLFNILYNYYILYNLDIIEFTVYHTIEGKKRIYYPKDHLLNHNHKFNKRLIYQPELSNILYHEPNKNNYTFVICRTLWNKLYKKDVLLKSIKYIGKEYYNNHYIIVVEDTLINVINFQFADNYSNINVPGYLYNIRKFSISHNEKDKNYLIIESFSFFLYFKLFLKYIQEFNKDRNYFYYEFKVFNKYLKNFKLNNIKEYLKKTINFLYDILKDNKLTIEMKNYTNFLIKEFSK